MIDTYAIFQQDDVSLPELPNYLWPAKGKYGLTDYEKIFHSQDGHDIYSLREINRKTGCVVIVRPDQHVATILPVTAHKELASFFDHFMI